MLDEADDGEDDEAGVDLGEGVAGGHDDGVPEGVVPELVIAGEDELTAEADAEREEDLRRRLLPHVDVRQPVPSGSQVELDAGAGAGL